MSEQWTWCGYDTWVRGNREVRKVLAGLWEARKIGTGAEYSVTDSTLYTSPSEAKAAADRL